MGIDNIMVKGEWFFNGEGPFDNFITEAGLEKIVETIQNFSSPFLVLGDDTAPGEVINEVFRMPVSTKIRDGNTIRFRSQILPGIANGDYQKASIFIEATEMPGSGVMLNLIKKPFSKAGQTVLTIECRITVQQGVR